MFWKEQRSHHKNITVLLLANDDVSAGEVPKVLKKTPKKAYNPMEGRAWNWK